MRGIRRQWARWAATLPEDALAVVAIVCVAAAWAAIVVVSVSLVWAP